MNTWRWTVLALALFFIIILEMATIINQLAVVSYAEEMKNSQSQMCEDVWFLLDKGLSE